MLSASEDLAKFSYDNDDRNRRSDCLHMAIAIVGERNNDAEQVVKVAERLYAFMTATQEPKNETE